jgi:putative ABC transport system permease protein
MFRTYFKIAFRSLLKNRSSSFINIGGLAVGMAVAMIIGLWIWDEVNYNKNFKNHDRIAQVLQNQVFDGEVRTWWSQAMQLGPELRNSYGSNFKHVIMSSWTGGHLLTFEEKKLMKSGNFMEPGIGDMLSLEMLKGSRSGLKDINAILLSESVATSIFGKEDPLGKVIKIDNKLSVKVTGVYKDLPYNSDFAKLTFIAPWELLVKSEGYEKKELGWGNSWFQSFVQIADNANMAQVSANIKNAKFNRIKTQDDARFKPELFLHPLNRWHLYSDFKNGINTGGRIQFVWLFGIIGIFVLLLACINFMNLSTARSEKRAKEVGIRKAIGSFRGQLIRQFYSESLLVAFIAFIVSLALAQLILPFFNEVAGKKMSLLWTNPLFWLAGTGFTLLTGLIAGSYPALYLSSFNPVKVLKGTFRVGRLAAIPRKALVVVQFTVSVILIICTIVVFRQIEFVKNRPLGFNRSGLMTIQMSSELKKHYAPFRNDLVNSSVVDEVSQSESSAVNVWVTNSGLEWKGKDPSMQDEFVTLGVDHDFGKTIDWKMKEGRDFSKAIASDTFGFILNEEAVKYMSLKKPLGETVKAFGNSYHVIGVVKNMVMQSPYDPVRPMIYYIDTYDRIRTINMKLSARASVAAALDKIKTIFTKYESSVPFEYKFADEEFEAKFREDERVGKLAGFFTLLAIFISCLGLYGMASYTAEQRTKEIGVRKVLGASVANVWRLLSKDFMILVAVAFLIATPIAYYFMHGWLQNYQYRSELSWWVFAATALGTLLITLITVSFQAIKAAIANPVKSLRSE